MRSAARRLSGELREKLSDALQLGSVAVVVMAFLAVAREGLETALLWFAAVQGATTSASPLLGITLGLLTAVVLGWGLYRSALKINLATFFTWTGLLLILVAAGIFKYGVHDLQEAGVLPGLNTYAFDISSVLDPNAWYSALLSGMFNITATPSVLETIAWVGYAVPVLVLFLRPARKRPAPEQPQPADAPASTS
jgi:high-affinity iron transporter